MILIVTSKGDHYNEQTQTELKTLIFTVLISEGKRAIQHNGCKHVLSRAVSCILFP